MNIEKNIFSFQNKLKSTSCQLVAVSKTMPIEYIMEAYTAGQRIFGENKVQELVSKYESLPKDISWHMIGHLQRNKVKYIAPFVALIHGVDSFKLLNEINKKARKHNRVIDCLLQVHIAQEDTKFGLSSEEIHQIISSGAFTDLANIKVVGLMGMATNTKDESQIRTEFRMIKKLFDELTNINSHNLAVKELSIGMSGDYPIAIEEGSTMIRIGSAIFGNRK